MAGRHRTKQAMLGSFGDTLQKLRDARKLSTRALAEEARISVQHLRKLEEGDSIASPDVMRRLAAALSVQPVALRLAAMQLEFWDLYPVDRTRSPDGYSLAEVSEEEERELLWFLQYIREVERART